MPPLKASDRLVQVKTHAGRWFRLQKSGGENSRLQHVDLVAGTYRLEDSFLVENAKLMEPVGYSDYLLGLTPGDTVKVELDRDVHDILKRHAEKSGVSINDLLRKLLKLPTA